MEEREEIGLLSEGENREEGEGVREESVEGVFK